MAQAARPWPPNPCAAFRPMPPPLPARRPDAPPRPARPKDAPCPASRGDRGQSGQCKKAPDNVMHKPSGGTYSKPDARVKLIPAEEITYVRHGKRFGRTVGSAKLQKRHFRRSVTPPPSSRKVSLARSTPLTDKAPTPLTHKATTVFTHKAATLLTHKATAAVTHKPKSSLAHKPTTPPPPVSSCLSPNRFETDGNRRIVSLKRPSPLCKSVQRGAVAPAVLRKETEMNPISPNSVHVLPAHSTKVPLATMAEPSFKSDSTLDNSKLCSTSNGATLKSQSTKDDADPIVEKEHVMKLSVLSPTSVLSISSTEVCPDIRSRPSSRPNLLDGKCKLASLQPETNMPQAKITQSTTQAPCVELSNDVEAALSTKNHVRNERQTNQQASVSCNMSSGAPTISHTKLYKKPDQSKSTTQAPRVELSSDFEAVPSTKIHIRNERQTDQEASVSCNMSSGAQAILDIELYKKPYQPESKTPGPCVDLSNDLDVVPSTKSHIRNGRQTKQEASISCAPLILHTEPCKKTYQSQACWKGKFEVTGEVTHTCDELEAHFPLEFSIKVLEASKQMPEILKLEALRLSHVLPKKFKMEPPDAQDIGLFFTSSCQRSNNNFDHLLENVSSHIGLRTDIGAMELLIFSSKLLMEDDQTKDGKLYLCGVFRKHLRKKLHRANNHTDNVDISNAGTNLDMTEGKYTGEIGMKLDATRVNKPKVIGKVFDTTADKQMEMVECKKSGIKLELTGEEETNGINKCMPVLKTADANATSNAAPTVSFFTGSAGSPCKSAVRAPACGDRILDSPPGFPLDVPPPGFTSAHRRFRIGETADSPCDVPPGFTSAHRGLHNNDAIASLGSEDGPVQTDVPPGFAKLLGLKKEALSKATEEKTTIGKVNEKHDKVAMEVDDSSEERRFPKIKRLSEILGLSSSNNARTSSRPSNCSEVSRKRGQREPSEPCAAETMKRLKVNGRIALTRSADRRALNSNQAQGNGGES